MFVGNTLDAPPSPMAADAPDDDLTEFLRAENRLFFADKDIADVERPVPLAFSRLKLKNYEFCVAANSEKHKRLLDEAAAKDAEAQALEVIPEEIRGLTIVRHKQFRAFMETRKMLWEKYDEYDDFCVSAARKMLQPEIDELRDRFHKAAGQVEATDKELIAKKAALAAGGAGVAARAATAVARKRAKALEDTIGFYKSLANSAREKLSEQEAKLNEKRATKQDDKVEEIAKEVRLKMRKVQLTLRNLACGRIFRTDDLFGDLLREFPPMKHSWTSQTDDNIAKNCLSEFLRVIGARNDVYSKGSAFGRLVHQRVCIPSVFLSLVSPTTGRSFDLKANLATFWRQIEEESRELEECGDNGSELSEEDLPKDEKQNSSGAGASNVTRVSLRFIVRVAPDIAFDDTLGGAAVLDDNAARGEAPTLRMRNWRQMFVSVSRYPAGPFRGFPVNIKRTVPTDDDQKTTEEEDCWSDRNHLAFPFEIPGEIKFVVYEWLARYHDCEDVLLLRDPQQRTIFESVFDVSTFGRWWIDRFFWWAMVDRPWGTWKTFLAAASEDFRNKWEISYRVAMKEVADFLKENATALDEFQSNFGPYWTELKALGIDAWIAHREAAAAVASSAEVPPGRVEGAGNAENVEQP